MDKNNVVSFSGPFADLVIQIAIPLGLSLLGLLGVWLNSLISKYVHNDEVAKAIQKMISLCVTAAGQAVAKDANSLRGVSVTISSPEVATVAKKLMNQIPEVLKKEGWDSDTIAKIIAGKIGEFQPPPVVPLSLITVPTEGIVKEAVKGDK